MIIMDETLRDGEQMPGVVFSPEEKIRLAELSSQFGTGIINIMPAISAKERRTAERADRIRPIQYVP